MQALPLVRRNPKRPTCSWPQLRQVQLQSGHCKALQLAKESLSSLCQRVHTCNTPADSTTNQQGMGPTKSGPAPSAAPVAVTSRAPARQCFPQQLQQSFRSEASSRPDSFVHGWLTIKHCRCQTGSQNQRSSVNDNIDTGNVNKAFRRASSIMGRPNVLRATGTTDFVFVM